MTRHRPVLITLTTIVLTAAATGCTTTLDTSVPDASLARQLEEMGFESEPASLEATAVIVEGQTATPYRHADGRAALLVSDASGVELQALIFDPSGELESTLYPASETAYYECWTCHAFYWSCYGSCVLPCWNTDGLGQGCHFDCSSGCDYITIGYCEPTYCD